MPDTSSPLTGKQVAFLVAHEGIEQVELVEPWRAVEQAGVAERVVAAGAQHEVRRVGRHAGELARHVGRGGAVDGGERGLPAGGEQGAQVGDHVGAAAHVGVVVKDRVAEEHEVRHGGPGGKRGARRAFDRITGLAGFTGLGSARPG